MKKTSFIIIGLAITVIAALALFTVYSISRITMVDIRPAACNIQLSPTEQIEEVEFSSQQKSSVEQWIFSNGILVEMTDSVDRPVVSFDSIFRNYINIRLNGNRLKIDVSEDFSKAPDQKMKEMLAIISSYDQYIKICLPRGPLSRITSTAGKLEIKDLDAKKITIFSNDYLNLYNCHFDSLMLTAGGDAKLTFRDSAIDYMKLSMEDNFIKINCCDSTTLIKKVDFIAREGIKTNVFLNEANIDTLRWDPPIPTQLTVRIKHPINIVK